MTQYNDLAERVLKGHQLTDSEAISILDSPDEDLLPLLTRRTQSGNITMGIK